MYYGSFLSGSLQTEHHFTAICFNVLLFIQLLAFSSWILCDENVYYLLFFFQLEGQKEGLENLLNNNLLRRERELQQVCSYFTLYILNWFITLFLTRNFANGFLTL